MNIAPLNVGFEGFYGYRSLKLFNFYN